MCMHVYLCVGMFARKSVCLQLFCCIATCIFYLLSECVCMAFFWPLMTTLTDVLVTWVECDVSSDLQRNRRRKDGMNGEIE